MPRVTRTRANLRLQIFKISRRVGCSMWCLGYNDTVSLVDRRARAFDLTLMGNAAERWAALAAALLGVTGTLYSPTDVSARRAGLNVSISGAATKGCEDNCAKRCVECPLTGGLQYRLPRDLCRTSSVSRPVRDEAAFGRIHRRLVK